MRLASLFFLPLAFVAIATAQDTNFPVGPQYLPINGPSLFLQPIATPSLSLEAPLPSVLTPITPTNVTVQFAFVGPKDQADLRSVYWGVPQPVVIEITSVEPPRALPASITDVGVMGMTDVGALLERGFGVTLGETASFWKTHKAQAPHVYTNRDIERLHGG